MKSLQDFITESEVSEHENTSKYTLPSEYMKSYWWRKEIKKIYGVYPDSPGYTDTMYRCEEITHRKNFYTMFIADNNECVGIPHCFYPVDKYGDAPIMVYCNCHEFKKFLLKKGFKESASGDYRGHIMIRTEKEVKKFLKCVEDFIPEFIKMVENGEY